MRKPFALYRLLRVPVSADAMTIKRAYRRRARVLHPDVTGNDPKKARQFIRVAAAYEVLSDPAKRQEYDHEQYAISAAVVEMTTWVENLYPPTVRHQEDRTVLGEAIDFLVGEILWIGDITLKLIRIGWKGSRLLWAWSSSKFLGQKR